MAYKMVFNDYLMHMKISNNKKGNRYHNDDGTFGNAPYTSEKGREIINEANRKTAVTPPETPTYGYKRKKGGTSTLSDEELNKRVKRKKLENQYDQLYPSAGNQIQSLSKEIGNLGRSMENQRFERVRGPKTDLSGVSDQELQKIINRARNEQAYEDLFNPARESDGQKFVNNLGTVLNYSMMAVGIAGGALALYTGIKNARSKQE